MENYDSDNDSIDFNRNQYYIKRVKHNRNRGRINNGIYIGALAFDILWCDNTNTREPIQNLIYKDTESVNEYIIDYINDYKIIAHEYPRKNRCCIMCFHKVHNGAFMCNKHNRIYSFLLDN